jgi:hypothetical protein
MADGVSDDDGISNPEPGTLEARLTAGQEPVHFIPAHNNRGLPTSLIANLPVRSGSIKNPTDFALTPQSLEDFDWLVVPDSIAYNRGGLPL